MSPAKATTALFGSRAMDAGRYWAFISYSHADEAVATWLHRALETYRLPSKLVGASPGGIEVPARLFPVFRDRDELASSDSLGAKINDALARAEALIVIASRKSATSHWVNEEIRTFKALGKGRRVFCVIVDGEPFASEQGAPDEECFAPALRHHVGADGQLTRTRAEPIAADIRPGKDGRRDALLKLVAGILDLGLDALKQRELHRRQRRLTLIATLAVAAAMFTSGLSLFAIQARNEAQAQRRLAQARQTQAEGLIEFMLGDLRKKLEPIGKLDILDAVGEQAMSYFGQVPPETLSDPELAARAQALRQIGDVRVQQGKLAEASPAFREALRLDEELVRRHPQDQQAIFNKAQSEFYIGYDLFLRSDWQGALAWMQRYGESAARLVALDGANMGWRQEVIYAGANLVTINKALGEYENASAGNQHLIERYQALLATDPGNASYRAGLASALGTQGELFASEGRLAAALEQMQWAVDLRRGLLADAANAVRRIELAHDLRQLTRHFAAQGRPAEARQAIDEALEIDLALQQSDPANQPWWRETVLALALAAQVALSQNEVEAAAGYLAAIPAPASAAQERPSDDDLATQLTLSRIRAELALAQGDLPRALAEVIAAIEAAGDKDGASVAVSRQLVELHLLRTELVDEQAVRSESLDKAQQLSSGVLDRPQREAIVLRIAMLRGEQDTVALAQGGLADIGYHSLDAAPFFRRWCGTATNAGRSTLCRGLPAQTKPEI